MKNYIVLDLEWNQSPDGKEGTIEKIPFEIIEIGAVKLNESLQVVSEFHQLIKPKVYKQIHYKISEVTHMDMEELTLGGKEFENAIREFISWSGENYMFCTWGSMDLTELQRNMAYYNITIPFEKPLLYYDIQKLYSLLYGDGKVKHSLDQAVEELNIIQDRLFHRALDDAHYTQRIMDAMDFERMMAYYSMDYYRPPLIKEEETYLEFPDYTKYVSRVFPSKEDAIADKNVTDMICCRCKRMLKKKVRWFSSNQKFYFCLAYCPQHGFVKGKIRMKKTEDGSFFAVKTMKFVGEEGAQQIYKRKEDIKRKRNIREKLNKC